MTMEFRTIATVVARAAQLVVSTVATVDAGAVRSMPMAPPTVVVDDKLSIFRVFVMTAENMRVAVVCSMSN